MDFDAVVLAGGASARFDGVDKALIQVDGVTLLDRVLTATTSARSTVVVGPERPVCRQVDWATEDPPSGGPVAGIAAGFGNGESPLVVVVSCDLPWLTEADVATLVANIDDHDGFGLRDSSGREQRLAAAYRRTALAAAIEAIGDPRNQSVRRLFAGLDLAWSDPTSAADDADTWTDLTPS
ncbi:molybdenum cofactor guanylyltransferase [Kribbella monticola]|uniref:molybdenum cofactor guanylyltransferase n=1 Tax=Kribbella monticola TaxID=2185285 RepID=UPI000DD4B5B3|nr:NTP transferase domain-containing protein [Kribbella monticola]